MKDDYSSPMGKSSFWWAIVWPFHLHNIKKVYESNGGGCVALATSRLVELIPESKGAETYIIRWLANKYGWKKEA